MRSKLALLFLVFLLHSLALIGRNFVVSTWGYGYDVYRLTEEKPFEKRYGVNVVYEFGNNSDRLTRLLMHKDDPKVDVVYFTDYYAKKAEYLGLLEKIDYSRIPNVERLYKFAVDPLKSERAVAYSVTRIGIVYRKDKYPEGLKSWKDLLRDDVVSHLALPDITLTQGPIVLMMLSKSLGGGQYNVDPGFKAIKAIKNKIVKFYFKTSELLTMFKRDEVWVAPTLHLFYRSFKKTGLDVEWLDPVEGSPAVFNVIAIVKGTKNYDLAHEYINFVLSDGIQRINALKLGNSPMNRFVRLSKEESKYLTYGDETIKKLLFIDMDNLVSNLDEWIERWNNEILSGD